MEECELLRADMLEQELNIEGEYVSEKHMREDLQWSEHLDMEWGIEYHCFFGGNKGIELDVLEAIGIW